MDRLEHHLWACVLTIWSYSRKRKAISAYNLCNSKIEPELFFYSSCSSHFVSCSLGTVRFAVACGLNQISDPQQYYMNSMTSDTLLGPIKDAIHLGERISLWWASSCNFCRYAAQHDVNSLNLPVHEQSTYWIDRSVLPLGFLMQYGIKIVR